MRFATVGLVLALVAGSAPAAFTGSLGGFQSDLVAASAGLSGLTDPAAVKQKKAVDRSLAAVLAYSPSLAKDMATSTKIAKLLEKPFPPEAPLLTAFDGVLDGLEGEIVVVRDALAQEATLLLGAKEAAAAAAVASVDASLVLAGLSSTRAGRAGLLKKAEKRATGARKSLRKGALAGFQGPLNGSFEDQGATVGTAAFWDVTKSGGTVLSTVYPRATSGVISHGLYDVSMNLDNGFDSNVLSVRQDGVLLSRSHLLLFDYSLNLLIYQCSAGSPANPGIDASVKIEVLFILDEPSTTVVLWTRELSTIPRTGAFTVDAVADQAVELPFLPSKGTLVFRVTGATLDCGTIITGSKGQLRLDHVRVE